MKLPEKISIILPFYNEQDIIAETFTEVFNFARQNLQWYEILFIDDGSQDRGPQIIKDLIQEKGDTNIKLISFRRNFGQTAAMSAGFENATGDIFIPMDADMQNDPADIPKLVEKMREGYDIVSGWRKNRKDRALIRKFPSKIANWLIRKTTGVKIKDYGCTLKAYKSEIMSYIKLYGDLHRFIPAVASTYGAKITDVVVNHRERTKGKSKYGLSRVFKVLLDLIAVHFFMKYMTKPIRYFGGTGILMMMASVGMFGWTLFDKIYHNIWVHKNPLFMIGIFFFIVGLQLIFMGLVSEVLTRIYYESQEKKIYTVKEEFKFVPTQLPNKDITVGIT